MRYTTDALRQRADLLISWGEFELGKQPVPGPLDYEDTACKLAAAADEIDRLRSELNRLLSRCVETSSST